MLVRIEEKTWIDTQKIENVYIAVTGHYCVKMASGTKFYGDEKFYNLVLSYMNKEDHWSDLNKEA